MQYYRLYDLTNQYPSITNYITQTPGIVNLYGLYPETNILPIEIKNLEGIKFVTGCTFRFIANIREKDSDTNGFLYTSEKYFRELESSISESNPYFTNQSLQKIFVIDISLQRFIDTFNLNINKENRAGVDVFFNNFVQKNNKINYNSFVKFLDWVVSLPALSEIDTNGVIPANQLLAFETFEINQEKAYFYPNELQRPNGNSNTQSGNPTGNNPNRVNPETTQQINLIQEELSKINADIVLYQRFIADDDYPNSGLSTSTLNVEGQLESKEYVSGKYLLNRKKQNEDIRKKLNDYLNFLKGRKNTLEAELNSLNSQNTNQPSQPTPSQPTPTPSQPTPTGGSYSGSGPTRGISFGNRIR